MRELDPVGTALRWRGLRRRKYNVRGPNALWRYIDGNILFDWNYSL